MLRTSTLAFVLLAACAAAPEADPSGTVRQVVVLEHVKAADVVDSLMQLGLPYQVTITESAEPNSMLICGDKQSVDQVLAVIARVDRPAR